MNHETCELAKLAILGIFVWGIFRLLRNRK